MWMCHILTKDSSSRLNIELFCVANSWRLVVTSFEIKGILQLLHQIQNDNSKSLIIN